MTSVLNERFDKGGRLLLKYKVQLDADGDEIVVPTAQWKEHLERIKLIRKLNDAGLKDIPRYGLDTYIGQDAAGNILRLKKYCAEFEDKFSCVNLYLWSTVNGTQKSTCAKDVMFRLLRKGITCGFVLMDDLLHSLLSAERDDVEKQRVCKLQRVQFLVIDECFTKGQVTLFASGYQKAFLNTFLKNRLEVSKLATCFTANVPIEQIGQMWGDSLQSLINRNIPTPMLFNDSLDNSIFRNSDIWGDGK